MRRHVVAGVRTRIVAHVRHGQQRPRIERRHRRAQAIAHRQRAGRIGRAIHRLREDRERVLPGRLDDHVEGLRGRDAELVDGDRMHVLPVGGDDRHLQPGNAHVEVGHRRAVDEAQPDALAGLEQPGPVAARRHAVHQVRVGGAADVGEIGRVHPHRRPTPIDPRRVAPRPWRRTSLKKSPSVRLLKL